MQDGLLCRTVGIRTCPILSYVWKLVEHFLSQQSLATGSISSLCISMISFQDIRMGERNQDDWMDLAGLFFSAVTHNQVSRIKESSNQVRFE